jgi:hypothetical protein
MSRFILDINDAPNTEALINYIKSLENVIDVQEDVYSLSEEEKMDIDEALEDSKNGQFSSHSEVMQRTKERYPNLFK